ncbi:hypothetical protein [Nocardioides antri]|uniref:Uncharacterized protein n=1 Tax=Nocardioides antri TaxID=2607659 RepID=A0A5B1LWV0_9ACTN|nr:hypothetical protein [Nocardioides antri]KAA1424067.1 hypothetical protein F0U47_19675 [Nocardioides antri]
MSAIDSTDDDFRVCSISLDELVSLQESAEQNGFATRWTSVHALRAQVRDAPILLMTFLREERFQSLRAYRCLLLLDVATPDEATTFVTFDIAPERLVRLHRLDRDDDVRAALARILGAAFRRLDARAKD